MDSPLKEQRSGKQRLLPMESGTTALGRLWLPISSCGNCHLHFALSFWVHIGFTEWEGLVTEYGRTFLLLFRFVLLNIYLTVPSLSYGM